MNQLKKGLKIKIKRGKREVKNKMKKGIQYSEREKIVRKYGIRQGINGTISTLVAASGPLSALGKYIFDSTPENFNFKERVIYGGLLVSTPIIGWGIDKISSKLNKYFERRTLDNLKNVKSKRINPEKLRKYQ